MSKIEIKKISNSVAIRKRNADGVTFTPWTYHSVTNIRSIVPDFALGYGAVQPDNNRKHNYPYDDKLVVIFNFVSENGTKEYFDIQDVLNQPTWTSNEAGLLQATQDINNWIGTGSTGGSGTSIAGIFKPIVLLQADMTFPFTLPSAQYKSVLLRVALTETIDLDGSTLPEGAYSFSGSEGEYCDSFVLDNPSGANFVLLLID
jgi:hypothetical protein